MVTHQGGDMVNENIISMAVEAWGEGHEIFWFDDDGLERFAYFVKDATLTKQKASYYQEGYTAGQRDMMRRYQKLEEAAGLALEVIEKHRQFNGDAPMGALGHRAIEELREAFKEIRDEEREDAT
jgi:hypothetical protein